jgi:DMSO/TMAO reductase YedYZ heme-binding membrane subunit
MEIHLLFAKISWVLFIAVMLVRPLNDIWHLDICKRGMNIRKYLGIGTGIAALLHVIIFSFSNGFSGNFWLDNVWNFSTYLGWGMLALIFILPPLITSNVYSQKILKKYWKSLQKLSYLAFILTGLHITFIDGNWWKGILPVIIWIIFWVWAVFSKKKSNLNFIY